MGLRLGHPAEDGLPLEVPPDIERLVNLLPLRGPQGVVGARDDGWPGIRAPRFTMHDQTILTEPRALPLFKKTISHYPWKTNQSQAFLLNKSEKKWVGTLQTEASDKRG